MSEVTRDPLYRPHRFPAEMLKLHGSLIRKLLKAQGHKTLVMITDKLRSYDRR